ncbi:hypothetical protein [Spirosoma sordidisoli]|uniref:Chemotaxis protein n=1 Tax=Spirosoma sordidisoli TaxID=2502893 RepID=A0A4Q2UQA8_9BACT|nr:hypothetical protein [Spirosoma sordidisoli]RYC71596.1 hypothetical protein EQG79_05515 [Spirosoma sordidisoli]
MTKKLGVFIIHGMGDPAPDYAEVLIDQVTKRLGDAAREVEFEACYWAPILQKQQDVTWRRLLLRDQLDALAFRRWIVSALGDPVSYLSGFFKDGKPVYGQIHACMRTSLEQLSARLGEGQPRPLMILAHSLGSVIASNYIWDQHYNKNEEHVGLGKMPFERTETLTSFITFGSNIPLFLPPSPPIRCIPFPHQNLPAYLKAEARWQNVFDPDDVLGYPLADIWDDTQGTRIDDISINAGTWPLSETPLSHTAYLRDDSFLDLVEERMRALLRLTPWPDETTL